MRTLTDLGFDHRLPLAVRLPYRQEAHDAVLALLHDTGDPDLLAVAAFQLTYCEDVTAEDEARIGEGGGPLRAPSATGSSSPSSTAAGRATTHPPPT